MVISDLTEIPRKLNIGCGFDIREGFLNIDNGDWHKPDIIADITDLSDLPEGYFFEIVAQDVLEHIDRTKQVSVMQRWGKLLHLDGELKVRVPSLTDMLALAFHKEWQSSERQNYLIQMVYGTQAYPGDYHRCGYTPRTVSDLAEASGLIVTRALLRDTWLYDLTFKKVGSYLTHEDVVHGAYFSEGMRIPDEPGVRYWIERLSSGMTIDDMRQQVGNASRSGS